MPVALFYDGPNTITNNNALPFIVSFTAPAVVAEVVTMATLHERGRHRRLVSC